MTASRLVMHFVVRSCEPRRRLTSAQKLADGTVRELFEPLGYFVVLDPGGIAWRVGEEDPGLCSGQRVRLTMEVEQ